VELAQLNNDRLQRIAYSIALHFNEHGLSIAEAEYVAKYISRNIFQYQAGRCNKEIAPVLFSVIIPQTLR
jgi:hypothetical protein